jgi:RNA polymerase sigma-70 factor (ECF subfamily)
MNTESTPLSPNQAADADEMDLISAVRGHDRAALSTLYRRYYPRIRRFLAGFTPPLRDPDAIIIDTFMSVWMQATDSWREAGVSAWIMGIAYRMARRQMREQPSLPPIAQDRRDPPRTSVGGESNLDSEDRLPRALARLPLEQRITLMLAYQMGYSLQEISYITQLPFDIVESRMRQARSSLRREAPMLGRERRY